MLKILLKTSSIIILLLNSLNYSVSIAQESPTRGATIECLNDRTEQKVITKKEAWEKRWSPVEKWVLNQLCAGEQEVTLYDFFVENKDNNQQEIEDIEESIKAFNTNPSNNSIEYKKIDKSIYINISSQFITTILSDADLAKKLPNRIVITNGWIKDNKSDTKTDGKLNLSSANIDKEVNLKNFIFEKDVTLAKAKIAQSIYFDDSTFKKTLAINEAEVKGNIFLRRVTFEVNPQEIQSINESIKNNDPKELIFLNLRGTKVESSINLQDIKFKFQSELSQCQLSNLKKNFSVYPLSASGAKVSKSIIMDNANFELCPNDSIVKGIQFDSINLEQNLKLNTDTQFSQLDLKNAQLNTIMITISDEVKDYLNQLKLIEILREKPNKNDSKYFQIGEGSESSKVFDGLQKLLHKNIKLEDVNAKNFQLESNSDVGLQMGSNVRKETSKECNLQSDGFNYQNINQTAFYILTLCLNNKYSQIQKNVNDKSINTEDKNQEIIQLFQPLEQAAKASRNLGRYDLERELLYKRKKLEIYIAPSFWERYILIIQDFMYGFGYHRNKILYFFLLIWSPGFLVAYFQIEYKQKMILNDVCKVVTQEQEDEELKTANRIKFDQVVKYIDSIQEVIFCGSIDNNIVNHGTIKVPFSFNKHQDSKDFWFNISLITLTPTISILFSTYVSFYGSLGLTILPCLFYIGYKLLKSNHSLDIKDVKSQIFITFKDENNKDEQLFYTKKVMGIPGDNQYSIFLDSNNDKNKNQQLFSIHKKPDNTIDNTYFRLNLVLDEENSLLGENNKDTIIDFIERLDVRNPHNRKIGFCNNLFPVSKLFLVYFQSIRTDDHVYQVLCFYDSDKEIFYVEDGRKILLWRLWKSAIFSIDILLPLVELDPELHQFIFDDSEGLTRGYFILQKILATIIASVLLPVLFITGL